MNRSVLTLFAGASLLWNVGCATKNYVRSQSAPVINKTNELDDQTKKNSQDIKDVDTRAQQGIQDVNTKAAAVDQKAMEAGQSAAQAQSAADQAVHRVDTLQGAVANLDNYRQVAQTDVHFAFDKSNLTTKSKDELDQVGSQIANAKGYIVEVTGGADSTGSRDYNYKLSEMRADSVVQYLAEKYSVPAHKVYLVGLGKDKEVAPNNTAKGRAENRRVEVTLLSNSAETASNTAAQNANPGNSQNNGSQQR